MGTDSQSQRTSKAGLQAKPAGQAPRARRRGRSNTSISTLTARAIELLRPSDEQVCNDSLAGEFLGSLWVWSTRSRFVKGFMIRRTDADISGMPGWIVARTRFIDDFLRAQIEERIKQLVILGAGYDSRSYRFDKLLEGARIFEIDHPAALRGKVLTVRKTLVPASTNLFRKLLERAKIIEVDHTDTPMSKMGTAGKTPGQVPKNLTYVPVDLDSEKLEVKLPRSGYDKKLKTLFIWEGVMMYLAPKAVDKTLAFIANNSGKGSIVVFDYLFDSVLDKTVPSKEAEMLRNACARAREPLLTGLREGSIEGFLASRGFDLVQNVTAQSLKEAYFKGKGQQRRVFPLAGIVCARVKQR